MMRAALAVLLAVPAAIPAAAAPATRYGFQKVMVVVFENTDYATALKQPFFAGFASRGALLADYHGVAHPSQPNYVAMVAGDPLGVKDDGHYDLDGRSLADLLEAAGRTWGVYAEGLGQGCVLDDQQGLYRRKHEPFIDFTAIQSDPARCANIKPASQLDADIRSGSLPDYSLFVPDLDDDGHDTGAAAADSWFQSRFGPILGDSALMGRLLVVAVFDESRRDKTNHVYAALAGAGVRPGAVSNDRQDHYGLLRTVEDAFGLGTLGNNDAGASPIQGVWLRP
ncbi:MAG: hypothetical protein KGL53_07310 [Elusimicrobia bacterium]|nr:hypothetical protein [Elusimicrobiota bacterium]